MSTYNSGAYGIDLKRIWRQFIKKAWVIITVTIICALIGLLAYEAYSYYKSGNTVYTIRNDYYIYLNYADYDNAPDYYNAYTWDGILRDDPIVDYAITLMPGVTKDQVLASVSGEILGDYRLLTVVVKGTDPGLVQTISDAYKKALPHFATLIDMIVRIDIWTDAEMEVVDEYTRDVNAAILGGLIGLVISVFGLLLYYVMDDGIYTERDWVSRYPDIPYLGEDDSEEDRINTEHILGDSEGMYVLNVSDFEFNKSTFEQMRSSKGVILNVRRGRDKGEIIDKVVFTLKKQNVEIKGCRSQV